jgi:hypothetical protein
MPILTLTKDVDILSRFTASKTSSREELTGLHVGPDFTEATNTFMLARINKALASEQCIIPIQQLPKASKESVNVEVRTLDGVFPDATSVLAEKNDGVTVYLNPEYLERAAKACKDFAKIHGELNKHALELELFVPNAGDKPLRLIKKCADETTLEILIMPLKH